MNANFLNGLTGTSRAGASFLYVQTKNNLSLET